MTTDVTISVVFTDLVGSTEMSARVGPEHAESLRVAHFGALRMAAGAHGGTEVKNLGDGLMVVYPSLGSALDGAIAMQQAIARTNDHIDELLEIRVGLSTGDATEDAGDYFGDPVVEAARLCAKAGPGQIMVPEIVRTLARRSGHDFAPVGDLELKGIPEPVTTYELRWEPAALPNSVPLPLRLVPSPGAELSGRVEELARLSEHWKAVCNGERRIVLLSGEAGMGKTRLATHMAVKASGEGATVLYGRSDEEVGFPYQPFSEALGHYVEHGPAEVLDRHVERYGGELGRIVPALRRRVVDAQLGETDDPASERYLLLSSVAGLLSEASHVAPVVLVLDDLHWADRATLLLLQHIARTPDRLAVLVVGTYRDTDLGPGHPLIDVLAELRREDGVERLALRGLDELGVLELMEKLAGHELGDAGAALAHAVRRETDGNPFFTGEILRHLAEIGAIRQEDDGRWTAAGEVSTIALPDSVREVVGRRIRRLTERTRRALTVGAVIGREFDLSTLCSIDDSDADEILESLEEAERASIVAEIGGATGRYTFVHALIQHSLYEDMSSARRARIHRRIGEVLEQALGSEPGDRVGELAHHWLAATAPSDLAKAVAYVRQAGERALSKLAPHEALRWFTSGLELLQTGAAGQSDVRCDLLLGLGEAQRQAGDPSSRQTLLEAAALAEVMGDRSRLIGAALANQRGVPSSFGEVDIDRVRVLERALEVVGPEPTADRASLLALLSSEIVFAHDLTRRLSLAQEARDMADALGENAVIVRVLNLTFMPCWIPQRLEDTLASTERALSAAADLGDPIALCWAAIFRFIATTSACDLDGMQAAHELATSLAAETGQPAIVWFTQYFNAVRAVLAGDADMSEELATDALQVGNDGGQPDAVVVYGAQLIPIRWHQGRLDELTAMLSQAVRDNPGIPAFAGAYGISLAHSGDMSAARAVLDEAKRCDYYDDFQDYLWPTLLATFAEVAYLLEDLEAAAEIYRRIAPFEALGVTSVATHAGCLGTYCGQLATLLDRLDQAEGHFSAADLRLRGIEAPFWISTNSTSWARMLIRRNQPNDVGRARTLLDDAVAGARDAGCRRVEREAERILTSLR